MTTILILSRDRAIAELLADVMAGEGYRALSTLSLDDAITYLNTSAVHLMISDLDGLAGDPRSWDRVQRLRQADGRLPLIVCATSSPPEGKAEYDISALVTMPFDIDRLLTLITQLTRRS